MIPRVLVAVVVTAVLLLRPELFSDLEHSHRAQLATVGVVVASAVVRRLVARRSATAASWAAAGVTLGLFAVIAAPSFRDRTLHEDFPAVLAAVPSPVASPRSATVLPSVTSTPAPTHASSATATARPAPTRVSTSAGVLAPTAAPTTPRPTSPTTAPPASPAKPSPAGSAAPTAVLLSAGQLDGLGGHHASGRVALYRVGDGTVLRFEDVDITGGAKPSVYLVPPGQHRPEGGVALGALKAEHGSFSYPVPASVDPNATWTVLIWCEPYDVPIGAADVH